MYCNLIIMIVVTFASPESDNAQQAMAKTARRGIS